MNTINTVIITADYQERYIFDAINSCISQKNIRNLQIIITFSILKNEKILREKYKEYKNVIFLKSKKIKKYSTQDQIYKISQGLKIISRGNVYLLDGDDLFYKNKIFFLQKRIQRFGLVIFNNYKILDGKKIINSTIYKKYKKNFLYRKIFNNWPDKIRTSSISISYQLLNKFYQETDPYLWKYLAIDAQLAIFFQAQKKINYINKDLTLKRIHLNNLDSTFSNVFTAIYWKRRAEQHKLYKNITNKKIYFSLDYFLTKIILLIVRI